MKKPEPLFHSPTRKHCPICGDVSYSVAGIHPQCAMQQADAQRMKILVATRKSSEKPSAASNLKPWQKKCPKCTAVVPIRTKICECNHQFFVSRSETN